MSYYTKAEIAEIKRQIWQKRFHIMKAKLSIWKLKLKVLKLTIKQKYYNVRLLLLEDKERNINMVKFWSSPIPAGLITIFIPKFIANDIYNFKVKRKAKALEYSHLQLPYSPQWDRQLNELMSVFKFIYIDKWTASLGGHIIWIKNHPHSSFHIYEPCKERYRPSRITLIKAHDRYIKDIKEVL